MHIVICSFSEVAADFMVIIFTEANMCCVLFVDGKSIIILSYMNVIYSDILKYSFFFCLDLRQALYHYKCLI